MKTALNGFWSSLTNKTQFPVIVLTIFFLVWNSLFVKGFFTGGSLLVFMNLMVPLCCLAIGMTVVTITGGMDISGGAIICLVNVTYVTLFMIGIPTPLAMLIALLAGIAIGAINGVAVSFFRIPSLLATFATLSVAQGLALWIMPTPTGMGDKGFLELYNHGFSVLFLAIPIIAWYILRRTRFGIWLYATGQNELKSYASGVPTRFVQLMAYMISALMAGLAAISLSGNIGGGDPNVGLSLTLNAVAAVVIGGVALSGGEGEASGAVFGAIFYNLLIYTVSGLHLGQFYQDLARALIILAGVIGMSVYRMYRRNRLLASIGTVMK
jgi:ribose transport system permease protein